MLRARVVGGLARGWSPDQIAGRLAREPAGAGDAGRVSHEAIYTWLYALPRGELAELAGRQARLRSGRTRRRPRGRVQPQARIVGMVPITDRPLEAQARKVPGHWEGDLVIGRAGRTAVGTLVERVSRYLVTVPLPHGKQAAQVSQALIDTVVDMPTQLVKTLTWDQGTEMANHTAFSLATNIDVYFAHPHSPWERGTNENTNRWLREYLPKGTDVPADADYLNLVARELNNRPRRILNYRTPAEVFAEMIERSIVSTS